MALPKHAIQAFVKMLIEEYNSGGDVAGTVVNTFLAEEGVGQPENLRWGSEGHLLHYVLGFGDVDLIKKVVEKFYLKADEEGSGELFTQAVRDNRGGRTPFHAACQNKKMDKKTLKWLYTYATQGQPSDANVLYDEMSNGLKPIHLIAKNPQFRALRDEDDRGAIVDALVEGVSGSGTAETLPETSNPLGDILDLISYVDGPRDVSTVGTPSLEEKEGEEAIVAAPDHGGEVTEDTSPDIDLIKACQTPEAASSTILHIIARYDLFKLLKKLAQHLDRDVLVSYLAKYDQENGATPWHYAVCFSSTQLIEEFRLIYPEQNSEGLSRDLVFKNAIFKCREKFLDDSEGAAESNEGHNDTDDQHGATPFVRSLGRDDDNGKMVQFLVDFVSDLELDSAIRDFGGFTSLGVFYDTIEQHHGENIFRCITNYINPKMRIISTPIDIIRTEQPPFNENNRVGAGQFGSVYTAVHPEVPGTQVVIKVPKGDISREQRRAFEREAKLNYRIHNGQNAQNPYIVCCYGLVSYSSAGEEITAMMMERAQAGSLASYLNTAGVRDNLTWATRSQMAYQMADGLSFLHNYEVQILHRDIKLENILVFPNRLKIADFGLSAIVNDIRHREGYEGTVNYLAPELVKNDAPYSEKTDIYALSIVFAELVTPKRPYRELNYCQDNVQKITGLRTFFEQSKPPVRLPQITEPEEAVHFLATITRGWAMNPEERIATADELKQSFNPGEEVDFYALMPEHSEAKSEEPPANRYG